MADFISPGSFTPWCHCFPRNPGFGSTLKQRTWTMLKGVDSLTTQLHKLCNIRETSALISKHLLIFHPSTTTPWKSHRRTYSTLSNLFQTAASIEAFQFRQMLELRLERFGFMTSGQEGKWISACLRNVELNYLHYPRRQKQNKSVLELSGFAVLN